MESGREKKRGREVEREEIDGERERERGERWRERAEIDGER